MSRAILTLILAASLAANAWFLFRTSRAGGPRDTSPAVAAPTPAPARSVPPEASSPARPPAAPRTEADFRRLRTELEALGLAPGIVRTVIAMLLNQAFQQRIAALQGQPGPDEYWRNPSARAAAAAAAGMRELSREQRRLFRELVGSELDLDETASRRQFGGLPADKVAGLKRILADYADLEEQTFADQGGPGTSHRARLELLAREKRADIERLLSPEELLTYDLRNSTAAHQLRGRLGQFEATEAEFRALYPAFKAVLDASGNDQPGRAVAEMRSLREERERQLDAQLRHGLGEERYRAWQEANDTALQQTRALTARLNLPPQVAHDVIAVQKEFTPQLAAVDRDRDLSPNQRDARASALGLAARERLIQLLGPDGFEAYKRQGGGWLGAALSRTAPTPSR